MAPPITEIDQQIACKHNHQITIKMTLSGVSPTEHSVSGLEPVEPVFENITWQAKSCIVVAENAETAEP